MQEKNRHILINDIRDLPEHKAPAVLWENIEVMMLGVPADILPVHKPPTSLWTDIEKGIKYKIYSQKLLYRSLFLTLLVFIIGGAAIIYFNENNFTSQKHPEKSNFSNIITKQEENRKQENIVNDEEKDVQATKNPINIVLSEVEESINYLPKKQLKKESIIINNTNKTIVQFPKDIHLTTLKPIDVRFITNQQKKEADSLSLYNLYYTHNKINDDDFQNCNFHRPKQMFYISPGFEYQYFLNSIEPENAKMKYWYSADLSILFQRDRFSVETGLGVGFSKDKINYSYNYLTNELINSYIYVDSIYYDPVTGTTQYFTTTVDVYDSIPHSKLSSSKTEYTYFQIPLELGYEIWKNKKYSFCIKLGVTYFSEINRKETYPVIYHENSRITSYNSYEIIRKKEFFRMSGGLEFRWKINSNLRFTSKPTFNYFLNRIYDNKDNRENPIVLGIRFGLYYKL
ncbi:MAG: hypothetical protein K8R41_09350 [Bacteroidales bacterium]|nr:hypothetical protein [Bacteroidales bacterium]